jgi:adenine deaminase
MERSAKPAPERAALIDVALGHKPADALVVGGRLVDVHTGTIRHEDVAIKGRRIAAVGDLQYTRGEATRVVDAGGSFLVPGLVDPHLHQWHTYTNSTVFAQCNLLHGTTSVVDGFYGHGILTGTKSVRFFLDELKATPVKALFVVPTLCYTQNRYLGLPASPNAPTVADLFEMLDWEETIGVEETGYDLLLDPGQRDLELLGFLEEALRRGKVVSGHGAGLPDDRSVNGFLAAGVTNNHELVAGDEARRQAELGLVALIREGASCSDTHQVARAVTEAGLASRAFLLCPDVVTTDGMFAPGQQDNCIRAAVRNGIPPVQAIQMSTIQPAEHFRVSHEVGLIAAGRRADIVLVDDLSDFAIDRVIADGEICVEGGELTWRGAQPAYPRWLYKTMNVPRRLEPADFRIKAGTRPSARVRAILVQDGLLESEETVEELAVRDGNVLPDPARGVNKIAMVDRVFGSGEIGVSFVRGFGIADGAIGTSANVFNQNVVVVGASEEDMAVAANAIVDMGGGFVAVRNGAVVAEFPTPLNGLVSDCSYDETRRRIEALLGAWREMGCRLAYPQINLEFVTLVTIPRMRISTKGLAVIEGSTYRFVETLLD